MHPPSIDLDRLLKLRLVVARFGEMDLAKWWNTRGQLGRLGETEKQLDAALAGLRDKCTRLIGAGLKVVRS